MTGVGRDLWCETALVDGVVQHGVRLTWDDAGVLTAVEAGTEPAPGQDRAGLVVPGAANAHSHLFHRALRGRTHGDGGDFWRWREAMYAQATRLDPASYRALAVAVFAEMLAAGWTAVGEFHYLHHRPDGRPYLDHAMERAVVEAAAEVGLRLTLLDTCYLAGGPGAPLAGAQVRFGDGSAEGWLGRWAGLREALQGAGGEPSAHDGLSSGALVLGAAVHSVRAVPPEAMAVIAEQLPADVPLHVHLSEQPAENEDCLRVHGVTPTGLLTRTGLLGRVSVVHATHVTDDDIALLGGAGATVVMCPTTEADLGDGIGPARRLVDAGCAVALGSDQNAVIDPFAEARGLEMGERLARRRRGVFAPDELTRALGPAGHRSLGLRGGALRVGDPADLVELDGSSVRTVGADPRAFALVASAADVRRVVVAGRTRVADGRLVRPVDGTDDPAELLARALRG